MEKKTEAIGIRVSFQLKTKLERIAYSEKRTLGNLITNVLQNYIADNDPELTSEEKAFAEKEERIKRIASKIMTN